MVCMLQCGLVAMVAMVCMLQCGLVAMVSKGCYGVYSTVWSSCYGI